MFPFPYCTNITQYGQNQATIPNNGITVRIYYTYQSQNSRGCLPKETFKYNVRGGGDLSQNADTADTRQDGVGTVVEG